MLKKAEKSCQDYLKLSADILWSILQRRYVTPKTDDRIYMRLAEGLTGRYDGGTFL